MINEDTVDSNLLFLGTEFGLWISIDGGEHWAQYKGSDFPAVAVRDIVVQPRESDLVLATHGRGIWIIDDISSLRLLTPEVMAKDAVLLDSTSTQYLNANGGWAEGDATYSRPQPHPGRLHHLLPEEPAYFWRHEDRNYRSATANWWIPSRAASIGA